MKTITATIAAALFSVSASASDVYHGLERGNSDIDTGHEESYAGVQPGVGDSFDIYSGLADGNADLFKSDHSGTTDSGDSPDIYMGISGNPDLQF